MKFDPKNHQNPCNDRFILSKGHAAPALYSVWQQLGILTEKELMEYRSINSVLEGHPTPRFSRTEAATGSLGQGLSIAAGIARAAFMDKLSYHVYCLMGDMETTEGSVWEAAEIAAHYKLNNLIAIIDCNRLGQSSPTLHEYHFNRYAEKFNAFGWQSYITDGHDVAQLMQTFDEIKNNKNDTPIIIIAKTVKGYGIKQVENKEGFHGKVFMPDELPLLLDEMKKRFPGAATYHKNDWKPQAPSCLQKTSTSSEKISLPIPNFKIGTSLATRKAFGQALQLLGAVSDRVVSLDAEVKNSTYAELFAEKYPDRFTQCFIAEQNMVGMAVGLANRGKIPFVSTFGAFFTRAFDQIRMAAISRAPLRLVGSHAGVSIGQDGPSQMALEDIAFMRIIYDSVILYPSDAVSTQRMVELMANRNDGITYLRTTRMDTSVIYNNDEQFSIGGCKVLLQSDNDVACIIAAGITLHEALKAFTLLKNENISVAIIDLYSIKPFDQKTVLNVARSSHKKIITVEDHYLEGGLGQTVAAALCNENLSITNLAVTKLPRSGKPEALMAWEGIDAPAIAQAIKRSLI